MAINTEILKNLSTLSIGTVLAQSIPLLFAPVIARLYSAEQFGYFAAIIALVNVFSVVINMRYELSVILPEKDKDSNELIIGSWVIGVAMSIVIFFGLNLFSDQISDKLEIEIGFADVLIVSVMLLAVSIWQPLNYFFIRQKAFTAMALNKVMKTGSLTIITLLIGWLSWTGVSNGLVLGVFFGWLVLVLFSIYQSYKIGFKLKAIEWSNVKVQLINYKDYPLFNSLPAILNSFGSQLGVYVFTIYFSQEITGYYSFSKQYIYVPMSIIGASLAQVYFQRIAEKYKNRQSVFGELKLVLLMLSTISLGVVLVVQFFVVDVFDFVFGVKWNQSAEMSKMLVLYFSVQFVVSPISNVLHALKRIKLASVFPFVYVISIGLLFLLPKMSLGSFLPYYVFAEGIPYLIYLGLILLAVIQYEDKLKSSN